MFAISEVLVNKIYINNRIHSRSVATVPANENSNQTAASPILVSRLRRALSLKFLFFFALLVLVLFRQEVAVVNTSHNNVFILNHLAVHVGEEALLLGKEGLKAACRNMTEAAS